MKIAVINIILIIALAVNFSSCSGTAGSQKAGETESNNTSESAEVTKPKSDYPPLAAKLAQAEMTGLDNSTSKIADRKGKVVLLNLWATWCGPCLSEMPTLVRLQEKLGPSGLEIVGLNVDDESVDLINNFAGKHGLNYTLAWVSGPMQSELLKLSKFAGIPQSFVVDRDGNLRGVFRGANPKDVREMEQLVTKVVNEQS